MASHPRKRRDVTGLFSFLHGLWSRAGVGSAAPARIPATGLTAKIRDNERIWAGFRGLELRMLAAGSLREVLDVLICELPEIFPTVQAVTVAWLDPEYELARQIEMEAAGPRTLRGLLSVTDEALARYPLRPQLGRLAAEDRERLFPGSAQPLRSAAIAPLMLRGEHIGSLNQASEDSAHFSNEAATDLLEHLAAISALCIDNAVNRARLLRDGLTDALTAIANRRFFERRLQEELSLWGRHGGSLSCLLVDVDHFKQVNDRFGHQTGDFALQQVASLLNEGLRTSDVLARYGGEEFVLLLPGTDAVTANEIAERLRNRIAQSGLLPPSGIPLSLTVSIGHATLAGGTAADGRDLATQLLQAADRALYAAKSMGRNRVEAGDLTAEPANDRIDQDP